MPAMDTNVLVAHCNRGSLALISMGQDTGFHVLLLVPGLEALLAYFSGFLNLDSWLLLFISLISFNHFSCKFSRRSSFLAWFQLIHCCTSLNFTLEGEHELTQP